MLTEFKVAAGKGEGIAVNGGEAAAQQQFITLQQEHPHPQFVLASVVMTM